VLIFEIKNIKKSVYIKNYLFSYLKERILLKMLALLFCFLFLFNFTLSGHGDHDISSLNLPDHLVDRIHQLSAAQKAELKSRLYLERSKAFVDSRRRGFAKRDETDLTAQRLINAEVWTIRARNPGTMAYAYATAVNYSTIFHTVKFAGNFGPAIVAQEYDNLVTDLIYILGYNPVEFPYIGWDVSTTKWITPDILRVDYQQLANNGYIGNNTYIYTNQEFRQQEYIVFDPNSPLINLGYTINDPNAVTMFELTTAAYTPYLVCTFFIFPACNVVNATGYNYLLDTGFASVDDCITFMSNLSPNQPCPYDLRSNTTACRALHAISSFFLPSVHCSHVKRDSLVCTESCLPACSNCDVNAECVDTSSPPDFIIQYKCVCKNGYVGNGTTCTPKFCNFGNCPAPTGSYNCSTGLCMCKDSYTHQPTATGNNLCACLSPNVVYWYNNAPICLPPGRCINDANRYMCNLQQYSEVTCAPMNNSFNPLSKCVCNYGYLGGFEYPCSCPAPRRKLWSNSFNGFVCLNTTECTTNYPDCFYPKTCHIASGEKVGSCQ
jgi:hypothetical protein